MACESNGTRETLRSGHGLLGRRRLVSLNSEDASPNKVNSFRPRYTKLSLASLPEMVPGKGSPQGSVISPLLANLGLNPGGYSTSFRGLPKQSADVQVQQTTLQYLFDWMFHQYSPHDDSVEYAYLLAIGYPARAGCRRGATDILRPVNASACQRSVSVSPTELGISSKQSSSKN